jgi:hypothetical protein
MTWEKGNKLRILDCSSMGVYGIEDGEVYDVTGVDGNGFPLIETRYRYGRVIKKCELPYAERVEDRGERP